MSCVWLLSVYSLAHYLIYVVLYVTESLDWFCCLWPQELSGVCRKARHREISRTSLCLLEIELCGVMLELQSCIGSGSRIHMKYRC